MADGGEMLLRSIEHRLGERMVVALAEGLGVHDYLVLRVDHRVGVAALDDPVAALHLR